MPNAIILGCSHAAGAEICHEPGLDIPVNEWERFNATHSFAWLLAQDLGYEPRLHAISGGSNDAMFRIWERDRQTITANDIVIACWTGTTRREIFYEPENQWLQITHNSIDSSFLKKDPYLLEGAPVGLRIQDVELEKAHQYLVLYDLSYESGRLNKIKNILALNTEAQHQGITVINIDMFMPIINYNWPSWIYWPISQINFLSWAKNNNELHTDWGHYFSATHRRFADYVLNQIQFDGKCRLI